MAANFDFKKVILNIAPKKDAQIETISSKTFSFDVAFLRKYIANPEDENRDPGSTQEVVPSQELLLIHNSLRFTLDQTFKTIVSLDDVYTKHPLKIGFLHPDGRTVVEKTADLEDQKALNEGEAEIPSGNTTGAPKGTISQSIELSEEDIKLIQASPPRPGKVVSDIKRPARLVSLDPRLQQINFSLIQLLVVPIRIDGLPPDKSVENDKGPEVQSSSKGKTPEKSASSRFEDIFNKDGIPVTDSKIWTSPITDTMLGLNWEHTRVAVDGKFTATFESGSWNAWAWMLFGGEAQHPIIGLVVEPLAHSIDRTRSILLPQAEKPDHQLGSVDQVSNGVAAAPFVYQPAKPDRGRVPANVSAAELATNPDIYTEDPGAFCRPFSNPQRILSERSFFSILRTEMPVISAESSVKLEEPAQLDFDPPKDMMAALRQTTSSATIVPPRFLTMSEVPTIATGKGFRTNIGQGLSMYIDRLPEELQKHWSKLSHERVEMSATQPLQWNSESIRYQAATVARGHILEFRVRTRSNGYSLGGVAKTLTLAPRQKKRIQKISWSRTEKSSRLETQDSEDAVNDAMSHENSYENAVAANLSE